MENLKYVILRQIVVVDGYDCMKYGDSVFHSDFENTKELKTEEDCYWDFFVS